MIDVLFITRLSRCTDSGDPAVLRPLRLHVNGETADISLLREMAVGTAEREVSERLQARRAKQAAFPVLTPIYLEEYLRHRGIVMEEIACLEDELARVAECVRRGVRLFAICTTWLGLLGQAEQIRRIAAILRKLGPHIPIVVGGMGVRKSREVRRQFDAGQIASPLHGGLLARCLPRSLVSGLTRKALEKHFLFFNSRLDQEWDAAAVAEGGEAALVAIIERLKAGRDFRDLPNLALPRPKNYALTETVPENLAGHEQTVDWRRYAERLGGHEALIRVGFGCPYKCGFCDFQGLEATRYRPVENVMTELRSLAESRPAPRPVYFLGDNLGVNRRYLKDLARAIIAERLNLTWRAFLRADVIDAELAKILRDSGCRECLLGVESGDPTILRNMNKRLDPERALRGIQALDAVGIGTLNTFVVGFPGETAHSAARTADFISAIPSGRRARALHRYYLFRFMLMPLSPAASWDQRTRFKLKGLGEKWAHETMNAEEAGATIREMFLRIRGPAHIYMEKLPAEWHPADTRRVLEFRDVVQKRKLQGAGLNDFERLLALVRNCEPAPSAKPAGITPENRKVGHGWALNAEMLVNGQAVPIWPKKTRPER
jgi:radical SAM superfamily enzyme YgiQ (UPF0313 family)